MELTTRHDQGVVRDTERRNGRERRTGRDDRSGLDRRTDLRPSAAREAGVAGAPLQQLFPHTPFGALEAAARLAAIEAHCRDLAARLGRDVGLPVAALDYLQNISRDLIAPAILERDVLQVLEHRSVTDPLTGLYNRYHFDATLKWEVARCLRYGDRLSLLLIDVDHLKAVNDRLGHEAGDRLLRRAAGAIRDNVRGADVVSRYGGDEFVIILPDTDVRSGRLVAERLRSCVEASIGTGGMGRATQGTISGGLAELALAPAGDSEARLLLAADQALYLAKRRGGNCVAEVPANEAAPTGGGESAHPLRGV